MEFAEPDGGRGSIDGIVALVKVDDYGKGKVLPHEKTYKGPKQDQLSLLRSCRASFYSYPCAVQWTITMWWAASMAV